MFTNHLCKLYIVQSIYDLPICSFYMKYKKPYTRVCLISITIIVTINVNLLNENGLY